MEEERYTIENFEIEESSVIFDNKTNQIILTLVDYDYDEITHLQDLLNHYFKRIKELEKKLDNARQKDIIIRQNCRQGYIKDLEEMNNLREENQQLKQQLHDLPKKIVEEIIEELCNCGKTYLEDEPYIEICIIKGILDTILKKYGVENERK